MQGEERGAQLWFALQCLDGRYNLVDIVRELHWSIEAVRGLDTGPPVLEVFEADNQSRHARNNSTCLNGLQQQMGDQQVRYWV